MNQAKRRGLRVNLQGEEGNRYGIGAQISLDLHPKAGASRMVRLGSGYLSQNSATQVMGGADKATAVRVAWPSGDRERFELAPGQAEITAVKGQGKPWPPAR